MPKVEIEKKNFNLLKKKLNKININPMLQRRQRCLRENAYWKEVSLKVFSKEIFNK